MSVPPLTWLYVPADRPDRVVKALASRAHAVIVDLEDAVAPGAKPGARDRLGDALAEPSAKPVYIRVNPSFVCFDGVDRLMEKANDRIEESDHKLDRIGTRQRALLIGKTHDEVPVL